MNIIKRHFKEFIVACFLLSSLSAYCVAHFVAQPKNGSQSIIVISHGAIVIVGDPLHIEVVPNGYPIVGESWTIFVYNYSLFSGKLALKACPNASVLVTVKLEERSRTFSLSVNDKGQTAFLYLTKYRDVAFQAFRSESYSDKIVISEHYVSSDIVNQLSTGNLIPLAVSILGLVIRRNRIGRKTKLGFFAIICIFGFVTLTSLFTYTQRTAWGYPEEIIGSLVTVSCLWNIMIVGLVMSLILIGYILFSVQKK